MQYYGCIPTACTHEIITGGNSLNRVKSIVIIIIITITITITIVLIIPVVRL